MKNNNIKIKCEIDGTINICSNCIGCGFKNIEYIDKEELCDLLEV